MTRHTAWIVSLSLLTGPAAVAGQPGEADAAGPASEQPDLGSLGEPGWTIRVEPEVYFAAMTGDARLPSTGVRGDSIELSDLNLDSPRLSPRGRFMVARGPWRFTLSGQGVAMNDRGTTVPFGGRVGGAVFRTGDRLISDLSYESFDLSASYLVYRRRSGAGDPIEVDVHAELLAGLRMHHIDTSTVVSPAIPPAPGAVTSAAADELFAEPIVGGRVEFDFARTFGIDVEITGGGFSGGNRSSVSFSIEPGFVYRPIPRAGVRIGYRFQFANLTAGDGAGEFSYQGAVAGLYWGAQLTF